MWMQEALDRFDRENNDESLSKIDILDHLAYSTSQVTIQFIRRSCQIFCFRSGNRIATWLTYLSDVELGGATVFPMVDGYIVPKKGSAAFWYNLYASGEGMIFLRFIALN
ncbi:unnamed protein product [Rotaria sp. Silwood2]|nr:unnamed protein product [Rotaria sp. Silwood2]CAF3863732.1 unnamed protein product [Rotaria sp. Silwood2]CAF4035315.1 unnamed protein product [Rotaria sp. Silwood2]CAF4064950.1 unnamed protein product [Rotaria sp. Silwood2]